jgi:hypothetical protein
MPSSSRISKMEFLKLLGAGGTILLFGWFAGGGGSLISLFSKSRSGGSGSTNAAQLA